MAQPKSKGKTGAPAKDTAAALSILSSAGKPQREEALKLASAPALADRKVGRPRREVPTVQRTVSFTENSLTALKKLSARSGREGFDNPDFSRTVRVAIRLSAFAPDEEIKKAFDEELGGIRLENESALYPGFQRGTADDEPSSQREPPSYCPARRDIHLAHGRCRRGDRSIMDRLLGFCCSIKCKHS